MKADLILAWLPVCKLTLERRTQAEALIKGKSIRAEIQRAALAEYDELDDNYRDIVIVNHNLPGSTRCPVYMYTGGSTWGDSPTDHFDTFVALAKIKGLYELLEQWSMDDRNEELKNERSKRIKQTGR